MILYDPANQRMLVVVQHLATFPHQSVPFHWYKIVVYFFLWSCHLQWYVMTAMSIFFAWHICCCA